MFACGSTTVGEDSASSGQPAPHITDTGPRLAEFRTLDELASVSSAAVLARATGRISSVPFPPAQGGSAGSAPTVFIEMEIERVLSGTVGGAVIRVVDPATDIRTHRSALLTENRYLMYLQPAVYGPSEPLHGYAITGGPAGVYASLEHPGEFGR